MLTIVGLRREESRWIVAAAFMARASLGLVAVVAATLAIVAIETNILAANGLLDDTDFLLSLVQ